MNIISLVISLILVVNTFGGTVKTQYKFQKFIYSDQQLSIYRGAAKGEFITNRDYDKGLNRAYPVKDEYEIKPIEFHDILTYPDVSLDVAPNGEAAMLIGKSFYLLHTKEWEILGKFTTPRGYSKEQKRVRYFPNQKRALAWVSTIEQEDVYDASYINIDRIVSVDILTGKFDHLDLAERGGGGFLYLDEGLLVQYPKWAFFSPLLVATPHPLVDFLNQADMNNQPWCQIKILPTKSWAFGNPSIGGANTGLLQILDWSNGKVAIHKQIFPYPTEKGERWQFFNIAPTGDRILLGSVTSEGVFKAYLGLISRQENNSVQARWIDIGTFDEDTGHIMGTWDATSTIFTVVQSHKQAYVWHLEDIVPLKK